MAQDIQENHISKASQK